MYRDDQEAALTRADAATKEADRLRRENEAMRQALVHQPVTPTFLAMPPDAIYALEDVRLLPVAERARLAQHGLRRFPVAATVILNYLTFGLFGLIHFGLMHDLLPRAASDDPSGGKAIGYQFIPAYNLAWIFFNTRRLADRISLQLRLRGLPDRAPRKLLTAACILTVIPYIGWAVAYLVLWPLAAGTLQARVNQVARLRPADFDAGLAHASAAGGATPYGLAAPPPPSWR